MATSAIYVVFSPSSGVTPEEMETIQANSVVGEIEVKVGKEEPAMIASGLLDSLVKFFLENPIASNAAYDVLKHVVLKSIELLRQKGSKPRIYTTDNHELIEVQYPFFFHPIHIKVSEGYYQYFHISSELPQQMIDEGYDKIKIVSEKRINKYQKLTEKPRYQEEHFRLTKKCKWKLVKNTNKMRAKMRAASTRKIVNL